jgi:hypothetical protein
MCRSMWTGSWRTSMATHLYAATMSSTSQHRSDASPYTAWTYFPKIQQAISDKWFHPVVGSLNGVYTLSIELRYICYPWHQKRLYTECGNHRSCFSPIHVISVMFQQFKKNWLLKFFFAMADFQTSWPWTRRPSGMWLWARTPSSSPTGNVSRYCHHNLCFGSQFLEYRSGPFSELDLYVKQIGERCNIPYTGTSS